MSWNIVRALLEDARQQVLDNLVFRLLAILVVPLIFVSFALGFGDQRISVLWGAWSIEYPDLFEAFGQGSPQGPPPGMEHPGELFVQNLQALFVQTLGGVFGVMFCVAATAFFVPRMMEKGAADTLFSKPVGRFTLLLARYFSGLLFVAALATVLVVGMFCGFWVGSGYRDTGFLWGIATITYLYGILHAFSIMVGTWTRSSVVAILVALLLWTFSTSIHWGWKVKEYNQNKSIIATVRETSEENGEKPPAEEDGGSGVFVPLLVRTLDTLHYVLPKTGDSDELTAMLRKALSGGGPVIEDRESDLVVREHPEGYDLVAATRRRLRDGGVLWVAADGGEEAGSVRLFCRERPVEEPGPGDRWRRPRPLLSRVAATRFLGELGTRGEPGLQPVKDVVRVSGRSADLVRWTESAGGTRTERERIFVTFGDWSYEIDIAMAAGRVSEGERGTWRSRFLDRIELGHEEFMDPESWYSRRFGWRSELKFNAFFSVGSSLAFAALMLGLAWVRIRTVDF